MVFINQPAKLSYKFILFLKLMYLIIILLNLFFIYLARNLSEKFIGCPIVNA